MAVFCYVIYENFFVCIALNNNYCFIKTDGYMSKINYRVVYNRKKHLNAEGKALLQVEAYSEGKRVYFSTNIYLAPDQWDNCRKVIKSHVAAESLNYYLKEFITKLEFRELELWKQGYDVSLNMLKDSGQTYIDNSFLEFIKEEIKESRSKESTKINRNSTYKLLSDFKGKIRFDEVSIQLIYDFEVFLNKKGYNVNTVAKHMKHFRFFVNMAINKGYLDTKDYPFRCYKIKTKASEHTFLLPEELKKMEDLVQSIEDSDRIHVLDAFLFCCYTGLRYSDFVSLSEGNLIYIDNNPWIILHTKKTGVEVKLPLHLLFKGKGWKIWCKYQTDLNSFFFLHSNSKTNKELDCMGKLAGIKKHISFHVARHTNATLLLYQGVSITTVQKLLGHRNISTTQMYCEVLNNTIIKDLEQCL